MRRAVAVLLACLTFVAPGCTVVKPVVCFFSAPVHEIRARSALAELDDDDDDHAELPPAALIPTAIILIPFNVVTWSVRGAVGGLASGIVSDMNVVVGNASWDWDAMNVTHAFRTNAKPPEDS